MSEPDFVVLGAARAGTTTLHDALRAHPQVAMSAVKEPNHFLFEQTAAGPVPQIGPDRALLAKSVPTVDGYTRLFAREADTLATGDASPLYLYTEGTARRIAQRRPDARLIAVVRDPAERAWSHFLYTWLGRPQDAAAAFRRAVEQEWDAGYSPYTRGTHVLRLGRYAEQLEAFAACFPRDQLLVLDFADLVADPAATLARTHAFLGLPAAPYRPEAARRNAGTLPANAAVRMVERGLRAVQPQVKRMLPPRVVHPLARLRERQRGLTTRSSAPLDREVRTWLLADYYADDLALLREHWGVSPAR